MKKYSIEEMSEMKNSIARSTMETLRIGNKNFKFILYALLDENTMEADCFYSCFMNEHERSPIFENQIDCYRYAIETYNEWFDA